MYKGVATWKPLAGKCIHDCIYCSTKSACKRSKACAEKYSGPPRLWDKELRRWFKDKTVFVCSTTDLFADNVPEDVIFRILQMMVMWDEHKNNNIYLIQSKNPIRMLKWNNIFEERKNWYWGTTLETNRDTYPDISKAPNPTLRAQAMEMMKGHKYVTIEPILDFDVLPFIQMITRIKPDHIYIGADSKHHHMLEPSKEKVQELIRGLTLLCYSVEVKSNLERIIGSQTNVLQTNSSADSGSVKL